VSWQAVLFDFDGVILDSVGIKTDAFAEMFRRYGPEIEEKVIDYHKRNGGVSRYKKFRYFYEELLNEPISEDKIERLGSTFSDLILKKVLTAPFIPGAEATLKALSARGIPAYVVSGTPQAEIRFIVEARGLGSLFRGVYGTPPMKGEIVREIIEREKYEIERCLFIGDAMTDFEAALENGIAFVGIVTANAPSPFPDGTETMDNVSVYID
jgi:phosphoglycolate phosphatase-like HAD superfamily hydrolase